MFEIKNYFKIFLLAASYCHSRNVTIGNIEIHAKLWDIETDVEFYYILTHRYNQTESSKADPKIAVDFTEGKKCKFDKDLSFLKLIYSFFFFL